MSQQLNGRQKNQIISKGILTFNEAGRLEITTKTSDGTPRKALVSTDHVRQIAEIIDYKAGETAAFLIDTKVSIGQKTTIALPPVNENEIATRITSVDLLTKNDKSFPLVGYTGIMSDKAIRIAAALAPICAPLGGGYFSGRALLVDTKAWVGGIDIPSYYKNMRIVRGKDGKNTVIFSMGKTVHEISVENLLNQQWKAATIIGSVNDNILFIGRPSATAKKVYVVTVKHVLNFDLKAHTVETIKPQPNNGSEMAVAFFRDVNTFISLVNSGASLELTTKAA